MPHHAWAAVLWWPVREVPAAATRAALWSQRKLEKSSHGSSGSGVRDFRKFRIKEVYSSALLEGRSRVDWKISDPSPIPQRPTQSGRGERRPPDTWWTSTFPGSWWSPLAAGVCPSLLVHWKATSYRPDRVVSSISPRTCPPTKHLSPAMVQAYMPNGSNKKLLEKIALSF